MSRTFLIATACVLSLSATSAHAMTGAEVLKAVNHDSDQTLELPEAIAAAAGVFDGLSKDRSQTVTRADIADRVGENDWSKVNKDRDQTLELDEWLTVARDRFTAADANHDGKLDARELDSAAGQLLVKMIVK